MRKVIVCNIMSLDGHYEGPGRNVMALNTDQAFDAYNLERIRTAGTVLLGRTSYNGFSSYWPGIADAPHDPDNRALSADNRELSQIYNQLEKAVVSDSGPPPADNPWHDTTTIIRRDDIVDWLAQERERDTGDILTFGSRTTWNGLLAQGLNDELHLIDISISFDGFIAMADLGASRRGTQISQTRHLTDRCVRTCQHDACRPIRRTSREGDGATRQCHLHRVPGTLRN